MATDDERDEDYARVLPPEYQPPDIQAALLEKQRDAMREGYPSPEDVKKGRIYQVTRLAKGRKLTPAKFTRAVLEWKITLAMARGEDWTRDLDAPGVYSQAAMSELGKSRTELVEMARVGRPAEPRRGVLGRIFR